MLKPTLPLDRPDARVLCLGAHCDDIEIGCGATLLTLAERHPHLRFEWVVWTSTPARAAETRAAALEWLGAERVTVTTLGMRASELPAQWREAKQQMATLAARLSPDLVLTHRLDDRHQDHRVVAELTWNHFRDHLIAEYEIAKYEGDLGQPNLYVPVTQAIAHRKADTLLRCFPSQAQRDWFDRDTWLGQMRLRGVECRAPERYAEAFHIRKWVL